VKPNYIKHSNLLDSREQRMSFTKISSLIWIEVSKILLTKSGKDESLKTTGLDFTDPFASLGTIESFFDADEPEKTTDKPEPKTNSYFRIAMGEDEDEPTTKSKSGSAILGEFTSMFKGL
jgi:hypothetical protein